MAEYIDIVSGDLDGFNNGINDAVINLGFTSSSVQPLEGENLGSTGYDPYQCPPNIKLAQLHGEAKKVQSSYETEGRQLCPCCSLPRETAKIPLSYKVEDLPRLRTAYPLYFRFVKLSTFLLTFIFLINGSFNLITNIISDDCDPEKIPGKTQYCIRTAFIQMTTANKRNHEGYLIAQLILNFLTVVFLMFFFHYMRYINKQFIIEREKDVYLPSKYTLALHNINPQLTDDDIVHKVRQLCGMNSLKVHEVHRPYSIATVIKKFQNKRKLNTKLQRMKLRHTLSDQCPKNQRKSSKITRLTTVLDRACQDLEECKRTADKSNMALVVFERVTDSKIVKKLIRQKHYRFWKKDICTRAPEPTEMLWENIGVTERQIRKIRIISFILTLFLIALSFTINTFITYGQIKVTENYGAHSKLGTFLSILASVGILLINVGLTFAMIGLSIYEKNSSTVGYLKKVGVRLTFAQIINTVLITIFSKLAIFGRVNFYGAEGVLNEMFYVFITAGVVLPAVRTFNIDWFIKLYQRWRIKKKGIKCKLTQREIHRIWEGTHFDLAYRYAIVLRTLFLTSFYASVMPIGILISIFSMAALYWTDKYILFRRAVKPISVSNALDSRMTQLYEYVGLVYAIGNLVFTYTLRSDDDSLSFGKAGQVFSFIIIIVSLIPTKTLSKKLFKMSKKHEHFSKYLEAKPKFETTYELENPITRDDTVLTDFITKIIGASLLKRKSCTEVVNKLITTGNLRTSVAKSENNKADSQIDVSGRNEQFLDPVELSSQEQDIEGVQIDIVEEKKELDIIKLPSNRIRLEKQSSKSLVDEQQLTEAVEQLERRRSSTKRTSVLPVQAQPSDGRQTLCNILGVTIKDIRTARLEFEDDQEEPIGSNVIKLNGSSSDSNNNSDSNSPKKREAKKTLSILQASDFSDFKTSDPFLKGYSSPKKLSQAQNRNLVLEEIIFETNSEDAQSKTLSKSKSTEKPQLKPIKEKENKGILKQQSSPPQKRAFTTQAAQGGKKEDLSQQVNNSTNNNNSRKTCSSDSLSIPRQYSKLNTFSVGQLSDHDQKSSNEIQDSNPTDDQQNNTNGSCQEEQNNIGAEGQTSSLEDKNFDQKQAYPTKTFITTNYDVDLIMESQQDGSDQDEPVEDIPELQIGKQSELQLINDDEPENVQDAEDNYKSNCNSLDIIKNAGHKIKRLKQYKIDVEEEKEESDKEENGHKTNVSMEIQIDTNEQKLKVETQQQFETPRSITNSFSSSKQGYNLETDECLVQISPKFKDLNLSESGSYSQQQ